MANLRRINRAASAKDQRFVKPSTYPYVRVRVNSSIAPMSTTAALLCVDPDYEPDNDEQDNAAETEIVLPAETGTGSTSYTSCMSSASSAKTSQSD